MSTVTSFLTNISIQGQKLAYVDTAPFSINGITYRGLINTSQSGSDFIITQRYTSDLFHNIQVNETQFMVQVANSDFLPAEIKGVIGNSQFFLSTTNNQTIWYLRTLATTGSQSNVDLTTLQSGFITNSSNLFLSIVNGRLTMSSNAGQFNTVKPSNSNLIIGATSLSGNSGGGSGGITLTPSGALLSSYYIPFSSTISGVVTTMGTDVSGLIYDNSGHSLTVRSVVTNKIGTGTAPESTSLSIGNNALLNNISGTNNIGIGDNSLGNNTNGVFNIAIGAASLLGNINGSLNIGVGANSLYTNISGNNNIGIGFASLQSNTEGSFNIGIGPTTLNRNLSGINNIAIGSASLVNNTIGINNIAIGVESLKFNISGNYNTAIGSESLFNNIDGGNNAAVGIQSLYSNTTGFSNVAIGVQSLFSNTIGNNNIAIGVNSLYGNINGTNNSAFGSNSMYSNTNGATNAAVGARSLYNNTEGNNNSAFGSNSMFRNTTGLANVAIGGDALYNNTDGNTNTAVGSSSLFNNTNGSNNTAIGNESMYSNTDGENNAAVGARSLYSNTNGDNNTSVGFESLYNNTIGEFNVAVGNRSLYGNVTGNQNTAVGRNALSGNVTGNSNVAVGFGALSLCDGISNIGIGDRAGINFESTESENIVIGNAGISGDNLTIRMGTDSFKAAFIPTNLLTKRRIYSIAATESITADKLIWPGGGILYNTAGSNIILELPPSVDINNILGNVTLLDSFDFTIVNNTAFTVTLSGGVDIGISGYNTINTQTTRKLTMVYEVDLSGLWTLY